MELWANTPVITHVSHYHPFNKTGLFGCQGALMHPLHCPYSPFGWLKLSISRHFRSKRHFKQEASGPESSAVQLQHNTDYHKSSHDGAVLS